MWEVITGVNLGAITRELGDAGRARRYLEDGRRLAREVGDRRNEGYALHRLGDLTAQEGDVGEAARLYRDALEVRREIHYRSGEAETLAASGRLKEDAAILEEALALGREIHLPGVIAQAAASLALLPGGNADGAVETYREFEPRLRHRDKMEVSFLLFELAEDETHLDEAHRLLQYLVEHAPAEYRETMIAEVPLHRDIAAAWQERRS
jgi:tetratricopeptide (TPR) repeat protein